MISQALHSMPFQLLASSEILCRTNLRVGHLVRPSNNALLALGILPSSVTEAQVAEACGMLGRHTCFADVTTLRMAAALRCAERIVADLARTAAA